MAEDFRLLVGTKIDDTKLQAQLDALKQKTVTVTPIVKTGGTKEVKTLEDSMGNLVKVTTKFNGAGKEVSKTISQFTENTQKATKQNDLLGKSFVYTFGKVTKFYIITKIIQTFTQAIGDAFVAVKEFDSAMTDFKKVSDLNGDSLDAYADKLGKLGLSVSRTRTEMISASAEFVKSGYSEEQSASLAKVASLYQNVADSQIDAGEASSFIISQLKAFKMNANEATTVIDMLNEVSNKFSVSSTDIATGLTKSSSALAVYGNEMSESIALVTAGSEIMTGQASKVSKGLRSIGANVVKLQDEQKQLSINVGNTTKQIELFDEAGKALSTYDILKQISVYWDDMSQAQQSSLALAQAG